VSRFQLLTDAQWELIAPSLPGPTGRKGRPFADARLMIEGIIYRYRCGIPWRDLPAIYGPWQTVWRWHRRMARDGVWDQIQTRLAAQADAAGLLDWSCSVDSTIARAHQHATNITRPEKGVVDLDDAPE
jgi:transposase